MIGRRPSSGHGRGAQGGRSILRLLAGHGSRERIRSFFLQMPPEEARVRVDRQQLLQVAGLPRGRAYALEFIPAQGGCVVALVPPGFGVERSNDEGARVSATLPGAGRAREAATT